MALCPGLHEWAGTRKNIHPLTPIVVINRPLSASSIYYDPWHPPGSIYTPDSLFPQSLSKFSLVYLLAWHPPLHTPYIYSPNHRLLFAIHAHTIATHFTVVPRSCHLILISLSLSHILLYHPLQLQLNWYSSTRVSKQCVESLPLSASRSVSYSWLRFKYPSLIWLIDDITVRVTGGLQKTVHIIPKGYLVGWL